MSENQGVAPPNYSTERGQFRLLASDTFYVDTNPIIEGIGLYSYWSDDEIDAYLALDDNIFRAIGYAYAALANIAAREAESIKDFDLALDRRQKAEELGKRAEWFFMRANQVDSEGDAGITITYTGSEPECLPEMGPYSFNPFRCRCSVPCGGCVI